MSAPLPDALRARFQGYIEEGLSGRAAALRLKLSPATGACERTPIPSENSSASSATHIKKDTGRDRTPSCSCKAATCRMGAAPHASDARNARTACVHSSSADCCAIAYQAADETSVKTNLTRQRGRSRRGDRLVMNAPFGAWGTQTFVAGLSADAMIALWVIKGAMNGPAFAAYVEKKCWYPNSLPE